MINRHKIFLQLQQIFRSIYFKMGNRYKRYRWSDNSNVFLLSKWWSKF